MATKTICDYLVLSDAPANFGIYEFDLPDDFVEGTNRAKPILQFRVEAKGDTNIWVHVNDATSNPKQTNAEVRFSLAKGGWQSLHEAISGTKFKPGERNKITIGRPPSGSSGEIALADTVLWFQRRLEG